MESQEWAIVLFLVGAVARPVLLYLREWLKTKTSFDWRYLVGQLISVAIVTVPMLNSWAEQLSGATLTMAPVLGWAAADLGREVQKTLAPNFTKE
jgi:hypothetical protein